MVLGPVGTDPVVLVRFKKDIPAELLTAIKERFAEAIIDVVTEDETEDGTVLGFSCDQEELEMQAEQVKLVKRRVTDGLQAEFTVENKESFLNPDKISDLYDKDGLFSSADRVQLVFSMLHSVNVLGPGSISSNLSRLLDKLEVSYRRKLSQDDKHEDEKTFPLIHVLESHDFIDAITAVHVPHLKEKIFKQACKWSSFTPLEDIRDYYGEEVAFYFCWMRFLVDYLLLPGIAAAIVRVIRIYRDDTIDTCELTPFLGIFVFMWGIVFLRQWEREECRIAYRYVSSFQKNLAFEKSFQILNMSF